MKKILFLLVMVTACNVFAEDVQLSQGEIDGIILMREEEKLARDVYSKLYEVWNLNVFRNISKSEQTHMDRVKTLITGTTISDPIVKDVPGVFKSEELQKLYNELVKKGSESIIDAIKIGLTIEDLDIYDLEHLMSQTSDEDIILVYTNLRDASINHLNAFNRQLERYNGSYTAQYISQDYLEEILR